MPAPRMAVRNLAKRTTLGIAPESRVAASDRRQQRNVQPQTHLPLSAAFPVLPVTSRSPLGYRVVLVPS